VVKDSVSSLITISEFDFDGHAYDLTKYGIKTRATNMWNNWTTSDDIADMSEVISDVTQNLIDTSRMYQWGSSEAYPDRYVSFHDFNHIIGTIKRQAFNPKNDTIILSNVGNISQVSTDTKRVLFDILSWNRANGVFEVTEDGILTDEPKDVTFKMLVSRINENPQRYLHAIFDILCNTDILSHDNFKNLNDY
jgi:hypothetical protein